MKNNKIKIAVIGFGSIGTRHYRNLRSLGYDNVFVYDPDKSKLSGVSGKVLSGVSEKTLRDFSVVFICNPSNEHVKTATTAARAGCRMFIEKPLSHNLDGVDNLLSIARRKKLTTMVGCNMRFHPCLAFIKKYLDGKKLGKVYSISLEFGYYLPYWRPNQDYRKNYAAKKSAGGGIILDDVHEYDLLFWFNNFSPVGKKGIIFNRTSDLEIETEDQAVGMFLFKNGVIGTVISNYLSQSYRRNVSIIGEKGNLVWNFGDNVVCLEQRDEKKKLFSVKNFDFSQVYLNEIEYFMDCVSAEKKPMNGVAEARQVLVELLEKD